MNWSSIPHCTYCFFPKQVWLIGSMRFEIQAHIFCITSMEYSFPCLSNMILIHPVPDTSLTSGKCVFWQAFYMFIAFKSVCIMIMIIIIMLLMMMMMVIMMMMMMMMVMMTMTMTMTMIMMMMMMILLLIIITIYYNENKRIRSSLHNVLDSIPVLTYLN